MLPLSRLWLCLTFLMPLCVLADEGPYVPGFERFHQAETSLEGGLQLLGELNCVACHQADDTLIETIQPKQAPILSKVGERVRADYLRAYLADPHALKPGTTMPDLLAKLPESERNETVEALVHYLASTGGMTEARQSPQAIDRGKTLFHEVGCVACHGPQEMELTGSATIKPLGDLAGKYSVVSLTNFLHDPLAVRPSGRMPHLLLEREEAADIAQFLLRELKLDLPASVRYEYYEQGLSKLPDFSKLKPKSTGEALTLDLEIAERAQNYALVFEGYLRIAEPGEYTFHLKSDDGSRLVVKGTEVVNHDGVHPASEKSGKIRLESGMHMLRLEFFQAGGEAELELTYSGKGRSRAPVVDDLFIDASPDKAKDPLPRFQADAELVAKGLKLFQSIGCASCHEMGAKPTTEGHDYPSLAGLNITAGCLAESPQGGAVDFHLTASQRKNLSSAIATLASDGLPQFSEDAKVNHTMQRMNCYACHNRGESGGIEPSLNEFFKTTQAEMGDEGRIPPQLTGVGQKITPAWLQKILAQGANDRPYMKTRMPNFGARNVGRLQEPLTTLDEISPLEFESLAETPGRIKAAGRHMVGDKVFGCIKCHTFAGEAASGVQGIDMAIMTQRLNKDWFHRYLIDPPGYRPGTRMPTAWPEGKSVMPNLLGGDTNHQIEAIWDFLSDGKEAAKPIGLGREPIELMAFHQAVIYRNFIEGAGPRAIGIGFPERSNIAFDANNLRLALIWQGSFIDASRHWTGRGQGFEPPLGDNVIALPDGPAFAMLTSNTEPWPKESARDLGFRFGGYRLDSKNQPTFLYRHAEVEIEDEIRGDKREDYPALTRKLQFKRTGDLPRLHLRVAQGDSIEALDDGWFQINESLRIRITGGQPLIRSEQGDLIVEISFEEDTATIEQQFVW